MLGLRCFRRWPLVLLTATAVVSSVSFERSAFADGAADEARASFDAGVKLANERNFAAALIQFRHAYELAPRRSGLWNQAKCERALGHYAEAVILLRSIQREYPSQTKKDEEDLQAEIKAVTAYLGTITVHATPKTASITIDGHAVVNEHPSEILAGFHPIVVSAPGFAAQNRQAEVRTGQTIELNVALLANDVTGTPTEGEDALVTTPPREPPPAARSHTLAFVGFGAAAVGVGVSLGFLVTRNTNAQWMQDNGCVGVVSSAQGAVCDNRRSGVSFDNVMIGLGLGLLAAGTTVALVDLVGGSNKSSPGPTASARCGLGLGSLACVGSF